MKNFKDYANVESAKRALRKAGLHNMPVEFEVTKNKFDQERFMPVIQCELLSDVGAIHKRGFNAVLLPMRMAS